MSLNEDISYIIAKYISSKNLLNWINIKYLDFELLSYNPNSIIFLSQNFNKIKISNFEKQDAQKQYKSSNR